MQVDKLAILGSVKRYRIILLPLWRIVSEEWPQDGRLDYRVGGFSCLLTRDLVNETDFDLVFLEAVRGSIEGRLDTSKTKFNYLLTVRGRSHRRRVVLRSAGHCSSGRPS